MILLLIILIHQSIPKHHPHQQWDLGTVTLSAPQPIGRWFEWPLRHWTLDPFSRGQGRPGTPQKVPPEGPWAMEWQPNRKSIASVSGEVWTDETNISKQSEDIWSVLEISETFQNTNIKSGHCHILPCWMVWLHSSTILHLHSLSPRPVWVQPLGKYVVKPRNAYHWYHGTASLNQDMEKIWWKLYRLYMAIRLYYRDHHDDSWTALSWEHCSPEWWLIWLIFHNIS